MNNKTQTALYYASIVSLGGFLFGFDASVISGVVGYISPLWELTDWQLGLVVGAPTLAGIIAALIAAPLADVIGRKKVLLILAALYTVSAIGSAFAPSYQVLVAARFIGGLAFGSLGIAPMYIGEIAPPKKRGFLVSVNQMNIVVGFSVAYFANYFVLQASQSGAAWTQAIALDTQAWRWMLGVESLPALAWLLLLTLAPESPRWLVTKNRLDKARRVLLRLRRPEQVDAEIGEIQASVGGNALQNRFRIGALFARSMRLPLGIGLIVAIAQQATGVNAIYFYAPSIFEQSGVGTNAAFAQATLIGVINVIFTIVAMLLIDRIGRKPLLMIGLVGVVLSTSLTGYGFKQATYSLTPETIAQLSTEIDREALTDLSDTTFSSDLSFKRALENSIGKQAMRLHEAELIQAAIHINPVLVLIGILGFVASFAVSLGPVMWVLFSEIFPNRIRGLALAFCGFFNALASFGVQFIFPWELSNLGSAGIFFVYAAFGVIALVLLARILPETKGKSLETLERTLAKG